MDPGHRRDDRSLDFGGVDVEIIRGSHAYSMKANWTLLIENRSRDRTARFVSK
jgi:hypothetical protein